MKVEEKEIHWFSKEFEREIKGRKNGNEKCKYGKERGRK